MRIAAPYDVRGHLAALRPDGEIAEAFDQGQPPNPSDPDDVAAMFESLARRTPQICR